MKKKPCKKCRLVRTFILSILLGGGAGFGAIALGASDTTSMLGTFFGALVPILWLARQNRIGSRDSD